MPAKKQPTEKVPSANVGSIEIYKQIGAKPKEVVMVPNTLFPDKPGLTQVTRR